MATVSFGRSFSVNEDWGIKNLKLALSEAEKRESYVRPANLDQIEKATDEDIKIIFSRLEK